MIKGTKRRGPSNESLGSSQAGGERARDGKGPREARKVDGKPRECACLSMSPGRTTELFQRKDEDSVEEATERANKKDERVSAGIVEINENQTGGSGNRWL